MLGRNLFKYINLNWNKLVIHFKKPELWKILSLKHRALFQDDLGTVSSYQATLNLKSEATPKFFKSLQYHLPSRGQLGRNLIKWRSSEWAAPIVAMPKKDGFFLLFCYKVTINQCLAVDQYSLLRSNDLFATLAGGMVFTKLDLS